MIALTLDAVLIQLACVRILGMVISLPLFWGYVLVGTNFRRRAVFDVMAGTVVTYTATGTDVSSLGVEADAAVTRIRGS